jgi:hypothetical protein
MKKKILFGLLMVGILFSHLLAFVIGGSIAYRKAWDFFASETEKVNADLALSYYVGYRYLAENIKAGRDDFVKCSVDLSASSWMDSVRDCLENDACKKSIEERVRKRAPEILNNDTLPFDYIALREGIRYCGETPPDSILSSRPK